jgi:ATP-dependent RNA helicase DHX29
LTTAEEITPMGCLLSKLPTDVHLGKFLLMATLLRCLDPALTIAAALSSKSPFVSPFGLEQEADLAKSAFRIGEQWSAVLRTTKLNGDAENSDFLTIHNAFASWRRLSANSRSSLVRRFCRTHFLSYQVTSLLRYQNSL